MTDVPPKPDSIENELYILEMREDDLVNEIVVAKQERNRIKESLEEKKKIFSQLLIETKRIKSQELIKIKEFLDMVEATKLYKQVLTDLSKELETINATLARAHSDLKVISDRVKTLRLQLESRQEKGKVLEFKKK